MLFFSKKILVVEDDISLRRALSEKLHAEKYTVIEAGDGKECLMKAMSERPDLILLDLMLPEMNGTEALAELRADSITQKTPVIILSNLKEGEDLSERVRSLGISGYFEKADTSLDTIIQKIHETL